MIATDFNTRRPLLAPDLLAPTPGDSVDGVAATFGWSGVPGAETYQVQIASDEAFMTILADLSVTASTILTLYDMLPRNGTTLFWRVKASGRAGASPWSLSSAFRAGRTAGRATNETPARVASRPEVSPPPPNPEVSTPYQVGYTRERDVVLALMVLFFSLGLTIWGVLYAVPR